MKNFIKKYWKDIVLILLLIVVIILLFISRKTSDEATRWQDNYYTAIDSINIIQTKNDELIYERDNYKLDYDELDKKSQQQIKKLEKELDKQLTYISELKGNIQLDTIVVNDSVYIKDYITNIRFDYKDQWLGLSGNTVLGVDTTTTLNNIYIDVPLTIGLTKKDNKSSIFVTSENPYIKFSDIKGTDLLNTPQSFKHWRWNVKLGFDFQYGVFSRVFDMTPYVETGVSYSFKNNIGVGIKAGISTQTNQYKTDLLPYAGIFMDYNINF